MKKNKSSSDWLLKTFMKTATEDPRADVKKKKKKEKSGISQICFFAIFTPTLCFSQNRLSSWRRVRADPVSLQTERLADGETAEGVNKFVIVLHSMKRC